MAALAVAGPADKRGAKTDAWMKEVCKGFPNDDTNFTECNSHINICIKQIKSVGETYTREKVEACMRELRGYD
jgi:hypothetical protein